MKYYGLDILHARLGLHSPTRRVSMTFTGIATFSAAMTALFTIDHLWPAWSLVGQLGMVALAFAIIAPFFLRRKKYQIRWGDLAYRRAFSLHVLTGLPMMLAVILHIVTMPGDRLLPRSSDAWVEIAAWYLMLTGVILDIRAILSFGFDNLGMIYVYHPEQGRMIDSAIYGLVRHPVYSAVIRISLALALWNGSGAALAFGLFMPAGFTFWLRLLEERELIERFGEGYKTYRKKTPAFWPRLINLPGFYRFLLIGR